MLATVTTTNAYTHWYFFAELVQSRPRAAWPERDTIQHHRDTVLHKRATTPSTNKTMYQPH